MYFRESRLNGAEMWRSQVAFRKYKLCIYLINYFKFSKYCFSPEKSISAVGSIFYPFTTLVTSFSEMKVVSWMHEYTPSRKAQNFLRKERKKSGKKLLHSLKWIKYSQWITRKLKFLKRELQGLFIDIVKVWGYKY